MHRGIPEIGDVLITTEAPCGYVAQIDDTNIALAQRVIKYRGHKNLLNNTFLKYVFLSDEFQQTLAQKSTGGTVKGIKGSVLHTLKISIPCLEEQQKIADFLSSIDDLISNQEQSIQVLESYNRGLISKIFNQEIRFKDNNGNDFPNWETKPLKDNFKLVVDNRGKTPPLSSNGYPLIEINAVGKYDVDYNAIEKYVTEETYNTWFRKHLKKGDILFSTVGSTAMCSYYDETVKCCVAQNIVGLRFTDNCDSRFMFYLLTEMQNNKYIKSIQMNGVQPSIKVTQFIKLKFNIPCLEEQKKIANFLTSLDNVLQEEKTYLEQLKNIKKGLLQQMFI